MVKKVKRGQALIETMVVLALYFFMIGFLISSFQVMYNKMVLTVAAYEYARTSIIYESSARYSGGIAGSSATAINAYGLQAGKEKAQEVIKESAIAYGLLQIDDIRGFNVYGLTANQTDSTMPFDSKKHLYAKATISGSMDYLFPIMKPDASGILASKIPFSVSFVMSKERIWNA